MALILNKKITWHEEVAKKSYIQVVRCSMNLKKKTGQDVKLLFRINKIIKYCLL